MGIDHVDADANFALAAPTTPAVGLRPSVSPKTPVPAPPSADRAVPCDPCPVTCTVTLEGLGLIGYGLASIAPPPSSRSLTGRVWQWTSYSEDGIGTVAIDDPGRYTIAFDEDGTAVVTADCNRNHWSYAIEGSFARPSMDLRSHAAKWSPCAPGSDAQLFVDHLWPTDAFSVMGDRLELKRDDPFGLSWTLSLKASGETSFGSPEASEQERPPLRAR